MTEQNEHRETRAFEAFARSVGFLDRRATFENRKPPHPDILMSGSPDGEISFELVELIDSAYARRLGQMFKTLNEMPKYFRREDAETQRSISKKYSDAMIFIDLRENLSLGQRRNSYGKIFEALAATEFDGEGDFPIGNELRERVDRITVYRGSFGGPKSILHLSDMLVIQA